MKKEMERDEGEMRQRREDRNLMTSFEVRLPGHP